MKDFNTAINNKRQISENEGLTLRGVGRKDMGKIEVPRAFLTSALLIKSVLRNPSSLRSMRKAKAMKYYTQEDHITEY